MKKKQQQQLHSNAIQLFQSENSIPNGALLEKNDLYSFKSFPNTSTFMLTKIHKLIGCSILMLNHA